MNSGEGVCSRRPQDPGQQPIRMRITSAFIRILHETATVRFISPLMVTHTVDGESEREGRVGLLLLSKQQKIETKRTENPEIPVPTRTPPRNSVSGATINSFPNLYI